MKNLLRAIYKILFFISPRWIKSHLKKIRLGYTMIYNSDSYLLKTGYINSKISETLKDTDQNYIPWMNYPVVDFLKERLNQNHTIFEYGSGASTIFFAKRVKSIISVEYDKIWYEKVKDLISIYSNAQILFFPLDQYYTKAINSVSNTKKYDIIIIDGRERVLCTINAIEFLTDYGIIILDDSSRPRYAEAILFLTKKGYECLRFSGLKPTGYGIDETAVFYKKGANCLNL